MNEANQIFLYCFAAYQAIGLVLGWRGAFGDYEEGVAKPYDDYRGLAFALIAVAWPIVLAVFLKWWIESKLGGADE